MVAAVLASRWAKPVVFLLALAPLFSMAWRGYHNDLTANPIEFITRATGDWTIRILLVSLAITPLRRLPGLAALIRFRRMVGVFSFFYGSLHLLTYVWLDRFFDVADIVRDVARRPFIAIGTASFLLLLPLAITSTAGWIRRLGGRRWQRLHRLVYLAAACGIIHYFWLVKSDIRMPLLYAVTGCVLLAARLPLWLRDTRVPDAGKARA